MSENKMSENKMTNKEFDEMFEKIVKSQTMLPNTALVSIMAGIVRDADKDNPNIKKFAEAFKDMSTEEIISKSVLFTCNSIINNIWNLFRDQIEEAYNKVMAAEKSEVKENDA